MGRWCGWVVGWVAKETTMTDWVWLNKVERCDRRSVIYAPRVANSGFPCYGRALSRTCHADTFRSDA